MFKKKGIGPYAYVIQKGDTLYDISRRHLGDPHKWRQLYSYNCEILGPNPHLIEEGNILVIPADTPPIDCYRREEHFLCNSCLYTGIDARRLQEVRNLIRHEAYSRIFKILGVTLAIALAFAYAIACVKIK